MYRLNSGGQKNLDTAFRMAKGFGLATVWVNAHHSAGLPFMPYGGYKQSGIGRERADFEEYFETKSIKSNRVITMGSVTKGSVLNLLLMKSILELEK